MIKFDYANPEYFDVTLLVITILIDNVAHLFSAEIARYDLFHIRLLAHGFF